MKIRTRFLSLVCISGLAVSSLGTLGSRNVAAQQPSLCTQLAQSIGRLAYNAAFPLATYEGATCNGMDQQSSGTDYRFRVNGRGIWQGAPLWTDVIFSTDSAGRFQDIRWGSHNSPFWPPGTSYIVTAEAIGEFNEALQSSSSSTGTAGAVCLRNPTNYKIHYNYRWGTGHWTTSAIEPGKAIKYWWNYPAGSQTSPTFQVEFDNNFASGYTPTKYNLPRNIVSENFSCNDASQYAFSARQSRVDIHKIAE